jgi:hypothetical protein
VWTRKLLASHPFRRKKRKGWGTEVYRGIENDLAMKAGLLSPEEPGAIHLPLIVISQSFY